MQVNIINYSGKILHTFEGNSMKRIFNKIRDTKTPVSFDDYIRVEPIPDRDSWKYYKMLPTGKIVNESSTF